MRGVTHAAVGAAGVLLYNAVLTDQSTSVISVVTAIAVSIVGSLLPDIDHPGSTATRKFTLVFKGSRLGVLLTAALLILAGFCILPPLIGVGLFMAAVCFVPHRGVTHSFVGAGVASLLVWAFANDLVVPFAIGYLLHLFADMLTGGVPLFWPYGKRVTILNARTGGMVDYLCLLSSIGFVLYQLVWRII